MAAIDVAASDAAAKDVAAGSGSETPTTEDNIVAAKEETNAMNDVVLDTMGEMQGDTVS